MVKTFKKKSESNKTWVLIFAQNNGDRWTTKVAKMIVLNWRLCLLRQSEICFPMPSKHKIAKTEPIKNQRWPPQTPS